MSFSPIGDTVAVTKLAYELYNKGVVVAQSAPEEYRSLIQEVKALKNILGRIRARVIDNPEYYDEDLKNTFRLCSDALLEFKPLVIKYEKLGDHDVSKLLHSFLPDLFK